MMRIDRRYASRFLIGVVLLCLGNAVATASIPIPTEPAIATKLTLVTNVTRLTPIADREPLVQSSTIAPENESTQENIVQKSVEDVDRLKLGDAVVQTNGKSSSAKPVAEESNSARRSGSNDLDDDSVKPTHEEVAKHELSTSPSVSDAPERKNWELKDLNDDEEKLNDDSISLANDTRVNETPSASSVVPDSASPKESTWNPIEQDPKNEVEVVGNATHPPLLRLVDGQNSTESRAKNELTEKVPENQVSRETEIEDSERDAGPSTSIVEDAEEQSTYGNSTSGQVPKGRTIAFAGANEFSSVDTKTTASSKDAITLAQNVDRRRNVSQTTLEVSSQAPRAKTTGHLGANEFSNDETKSTASSVDVTGLSKGSSSLVDTTVERKPYPYLISTTSPAVTETLDKTEAPVTVEASAFENTIGKQQSEEKFIVTEPSVVIENSIQQSRASERVAENVTVETSTIARARNETEVAIMTERAVEATSSTTAASALGIENATMVVESVTTAPVTTTDVQTRVEESKLLKSTLNVTESSTEYPLTGSEFKVQGRGQSSDVDVVATTTEFVSTTDIEATTIPENLVASVTNSPTEEYESIGLTERSVESTNSTTSTTTSAPNTTTDSLSNTESLTTQQMITLSTETVPTTITEDAVTSIETTVEPTTIPSEEKDGTTVLTEEYFEPSTPVTEASTTIESTSSTAPIEIDRTTVTESTIEIVSTEKIDEETRIAVSTSTADVPSTAITEETLSTREVTTQAPIVVEVTSIRVTSSSSTHQPDVNPTDDANTPDVTPLLVRIVIEGTLNDICPRMLDLRKSLADILSNGLKRPISTKQIVVHKDPCYGNSEASTASASMSDVALTSILVYVVDEDGNFDESTTKILPSLYNKVSAKDFPVTIRSFLLVQESDSGNAIAVIVVSSVAFICLVLLAGLLLSVQCMAAKITTMAIRDAFIMRKRQTRFNYGERCRPVSLDAYSLDSVSAYNSVRRKGAVRSSKRSYGNPTFEDSSAIPSHPLNFAGLSTFCNDAIAINEEFTNIPQVSAKIDELPAGAEVKNRYANVVPLPETRVPLQRLNNDPLTEYINASYVRGPKNATKYYIACQAPMESTVTDFWRMIWEHQSKVVIMLTDLVENDVEKCSEYIPPSEVTDCHRLYGDFQVTLKKRETKEKYAISTLHLKNLENNTFRELYHIWYLWPVSGVQSDAAGLIAVLLEARALQRGGPGPIVVHCSPGTGRTGTLIALDLGIRQYEITRTVDVPRVVYTIRRDRAGAVQTKEQYAFIYKALNLYATKLAGGVLESS